MNCAKRIESLLEKMPTIKKNTALEIFEEVFAVEGCIKVAQKIRLINIQIDKIRSVSHPETMRYLDDVFNCRLMYRNITTQLNESSAHIMTLHMAGNIMPDEKIDTALITELSELLLNIKIKIDNSQMQDEYKDVLYSYVEEIEEGIIDLDFGGTEALTPHLETANGKIIMYNQAFKADIEIFKDINSVYEKTTKLLDDAQVWGGALGYVLGLLGN